MKNIPISFDEDIFEEIERAASATEWQRHKVTGLCYYRTSGIFKGEMERNMVNR